MKRTRRQGDRETKRAFPCHRCRRGEVRLRLGPTRGRGEADDLVGRRAVELWEVIWDRGEVRLDNELQQSLELQRRQSALLAYQDPRDRLDLRNSQELWAADELTLGRLRPDRQSKAEREKLLARLLQKPGGEERIAVLQKPVTRHRTYAHPATNLVLILGTLVLPALWLVRTGRAIKSRRERKRKGLCLSCGYDLRVSPERCPECGAVPAKD